MKLRNLMYATMIACAFASCSNDDVPTPDNGNPDAQGGTSLTEARCILHRTRTFIIRISLTFARGHLRM